MNKFKLKGSWRTTGTGIGAIVVAVGTALQLSFDDNPRTVPDWNLVAMLIFVGMGQIFSRDNKVSSEEVKANKPPSA